MLYGFHIKRIVLNLAAIVAVLFAWTPATHAAGLGISPTEFEFNNIIRGTDIDRVITLNRSESDEDIFFEHENSFEPAIANNWFTINKNRPLVFPKGEQQIVVPITISIPQSAELTDYSGTIKFMAQENDAVAHNVSLLLNSLLYINFSISEEIIKSYELNNIEINNFEESYDLPLTLSINNTGNIPVRPEKITLDFYSDDKSSTITTLTIDSFRPHEQIAPFTEGRLRLKVPNDLAIGDYWASVEVHDEETIIHEKEIIFSVVELNGLSQEAYIENTVASTNENSKNIFISGNLYNSGKTKIKPQIIAEVYRNNILIDILEQTIAITPPNSAETFNLEFKPNRNGDYEFRVWAEYAGLKTGESIITYEHTKESANIIVLISSILLFVIMIVVISSLHKKPKKNRRRNARKPRRRRR